MKKSIVLILFLTIISTIFAQTSFQISITFGNVQYSNLPDYSVVFVTSEPFVRIVVNGKYIGTTDVFGRLVYVFKEEGFYEAWVDTGEPITQQVSFFVTKRATYVYMPIVKFTRLTVFSNVYPVYVYFDKYLLGVATQDVPYVNVPQGNVELTFHAKAYKSILRSVQASGTDTPIWLEFEPEKFNFELIVEPKSFSPNNDWYEDTTQFKMYLSTYAILKLQIIDKYGKILLERSIEGKPGTNVFEWDGSKLPDGEYTVKVVADNRRETIERIQNVIIDTSVYTYRKEITLGILAIFTGLVIYLIATQQ